MLEVRPPPVPGLPQLPRPPSLHAALNTPVDRIRCSCWFLSCSMQPSPSHRRVGVHDYTFEACSSFTRVTASKVARPPCVGFCHEASSQPVSQLQCSLATRPNQHLSGRVLSPLVICAVGAHYETGSSVDASIRGIRRRA